MAGARDVLRRIKTVKNISQVTRALEAVSASRLRQVQKAVTASRAYSSKAFGVLNSLAGQGGGGALHPLLEEREEIKKILVILISSDRGLAGSYNVNVINAATQFSKNASAPVKFMTVGRKGRDVLYQLGAEIESAFDNYRGTPTFVEVSPIARAAMDAYLSGDVDEVYLAYTDYVNAVRQDAKVSRLLPMTSTTDASEQAMAEHIDESQTATNATAAGYIYEPSPEELLKTILPRFTQVQVYQAVLESITSEHSARMVAMKNATDNANDLAAGLRLTYNKARQLAVTSELLDIVGGVEALNNS